MQILRRCKLKKHHILIVDDEKNIRDTLSSLLIDEGFEVSTVSNGIEVFEFLTSHLPDVILLDIWMPHKDGLEVLQELQVKNLNQIVIIMSGHGTIETAVRATKLGAYDFIEKPLSIDKLMLVIQNLLSVKKLKEENLFLRERVYQKFELIGRSSHIVNIRKQVAIAAPTHSWILITGENGTGKELVARQVHLQSLRKEKPFIEVNCAAIPEELIESELFGHEKGSFTGAHSSKQGKFELADEGTLFLDEIGDMSLKTQAKILRVLQEQKFERVGGVTSLQVDVRVIGATNKDLKAEIQKGKFREDLYYRLNVIPIHVSSLRDRSEDIPDLVQCFLEEVAKEIGKKIKSITPRAIKLLQAYQWPGNVRELRNVIERLIIMTPGDIIEEEDISISIREMSQNEGLLNDFRKARQQFEKEYILEKLRENRGNVSKTAKLIGVERSNLHRKMKIYDIEL